MKVKVLENQGSYFLTENEIYNVKEEMVDHYIIERPEGDCIMAKKDRFVKVVC